MTKDGGASPTLRVHFVFNRVHPSTLLRTAFVANSRYNSSLNSLMGTDWPELAERSAAKQTAWVMAASSRSGKGRSSLMMQSRK